MYKNVQECTLFHWHIRIQPDFLIRLFIPNKCMWNPCVWVDTIIEDMCCTTSDARQYNYYKIIFNLHTFVWLKSPFLISTKLKLIQFWLAFIGFHYYNEFVTRTLLLYIRVRRLHAHITNMPSCSSYQHAHLTYSDCWLIKDHNAHFTQTQKIYK